LSKILYIQKTQNLFRMLKKNIQKELQLRFQLINN